MSSSFEGEAAAVQAAEEDVRVVKVLRLDPDEMAVVEDEFRHAFDIGFVHPSDVALDSVDGA
jgi:hypothetical protein